MKRPANGRLQFDTLDLFRTAMGFEREGGYAVIPQDIAKRVEEEFERLYAIEEEAAGLVDLVDSGVRGIMPSGLDRLRLLTGRSTGAAQ